MVTRENQIITRGKNETFPGKITNLSPPTVKEEVTYCFFHKAKLPFTGRFTRSRHFGLVLLHFLCSRSSNILVRHQNENSNRFLVKIQIGLNKRKEVYLNAKVHTKPNLK